MSDNPLNITIPATDTESGLASQTPPVVPPRTQNPSPNTTPPGTDEAPRKYADNFTTVEELEAAYAALLAANTTPPNKKEDAATPTAPRDEAAQTLAAKGLNVAAFEQEFAEKGNLSPESYKALEQAGFSRDMVDRYIQAGQIIEDKIVADMKALTGGEEAYAAMTGWAREHLAPEEIETYNKAVHSGDLDTVRFAVAGLHARYQTAEGQAPTRYAGKAPGGTTSRDVFRSTAEVVSAMRDPRYGKDPAYTREIEQRLGRSDIF